LYASGPPHAKPASVPLNTTTRADAEARTAANARSKASTNSDDSTFSCAAIRIDTTPSPWSSTSTSPRVSLSSAAPCAGSEARGEATDGTPINPKRGLSFDDTDHCGGDDSDAGSISATPVGLWRATSLSSAGALGAVASTRVCSAMRSGAILGAGASACDASANAGSTRGIATTSATPRANAQPRSDAQIAPCSSHRSTSTPVDEDRTHAQPDTGSAANTLSVDSDAGTASPPTNSRTASNAPSSSAGCRP